MKFCRGPYLFWCPDIWWFFFASLSPLLSLLSPPGNHYSLAFQCQNPHFGGFLDDPVAKSLPTSARVLSHSVSSSSSQPHGLQAARLPSTWDSPSKNTGVDCHSLLQGQNKGHEFSSWSWKILCVSEHLGPCATTTKPMSRAFRLQLLRTHIND